MGVHANTNTRTVAAGYGMMAAAAQPSAYPGLLQPSQELAGDFYNTSLVSVPGSVRTHVTCACR
jgi:hypothetical protein